MNFDETMVPTTWCNISHDFPEIFKETLIEHKLNPLMKSNTKTSLLKQPLSLLKQSYNTTEANIKIPDEIRKLYLSYRPTPFKRAHQLEQFLNTKSKIFYKYEGMNIAGSHKLNTAIAQAYYFKQAGVKHIITSTGAGQWGTAIAYACQLFGLHCTVFMVNVSLKQKPERKTLMSLYGAEVFASPSNKTDCGRTALANKQAADGSLAIATGEAIELSEKTADAKFAVGSGETHVLLHQTVIGNETLNQMEELNLFPDKIYACVGAGSNFSGMVFPFIRAAKQQGRQCQFIAVEPTACPKLTAGTYTAEFNDLSGFTRPSKMYTLGADFIAPPIHAGGLRHHGTSALLSAYYHHHFFKARAMDETIALQAGILFSQKEGILPAPESCYAIAAAISDIQKQPEQSDTIVINVSGHGLLDLSAYQPLIV